MLHGFQTRLRFSFPWCQNFMDRTFRNRSMTLHVMSLVSGYVVTLLPLPHAWCALSKLPGHSVTGRILACITFFWSGMAVNAYMYIAFRWQHWVPSTCKAFTAPWSKRGCWRNLGDNMRCFFCVWGGGGVAFSVPWVSLLVITWDGLLSIIYPIWRILHHWWLQSTYFVHLQIP